VIAQSALHPREVHNWTANLRTSERPSARRSGKVACTKRTARRGWPYVTDRSESEIYPDAESVPGNPSFRTPGDTAEFALAEYKSVREDLIQGLAGQQSILAWSIAAIGLTFAAGMALNPANIAHAATIRATIFGVALPLVAFGASVAWLGEIFRMERDAHYLRLLERSTWTQDQREASNAVANKVVVHDEWVGQTPLLYNSWAAHSSPPGRNRVLGYFGGLIIYSGAIAGSFTLCAWLVTDKRWLVVVAEAIVFVAYLGVTAAHVKRIMKYSRLRTREAGEQLVRPTGATIGS